MNLTRMFLVAMAAIVLFSGVVYAQTAGVFQLPFDPNQNWVDSNGITLVNPTNCGFGHNGYWDDPPNHGQTFMNLYVGHGYHMAEDWNGKCGASTDMYAPLYAIAEGVVVDARIDLKFGGFLLIRHDLSNVTSRYVLYEHVNEIFVTIGQRVHPDRTRIATIGEGNGQYPNAAHLHFEMRLNGNVVNPLNYLP